MESPTNISRVHSGFLKRFFRVSLSCRIVIGIVAVIILVVAFYGEENWRGKRAWENYKSELEAEGAVLDWNAYIPPPIPDDQNIFKAPKIEEWFVKIPGQTNVTDLAKRLYNAKIYWTGVMTNAVNNASEAKEYLKWSDQFEPALNRIHQALDRPDARIDGDYTQPVEMPNLDFVALRAIVQLLAQRCHCYLLLNQPEKAMGELMLLADTRRFFESKPTILVSAMINVAASGVFAEAASEGFALHEWRENQLIEIQKQLEGIDLPPIFLSSINVERAVAINILETILARAERQSFYRKISSAFNISIPRGWLYQNLVAVASIEEQAIKSFDLKRNFISHREQGAISLRIEKIENHIRPYTFWAAIAVANLPRAWRTVCFNQNKINEALIACALERYRLAHGEYPETLKSLAPQFLKKLPHDIIGGQPLKYRRTENGSFVLYSVGWNETDDNGQVIRQKNGQPDPEKGDWVWQIPAKQLNAQ
jgi:hypothetical protein